MNKKEFKDAINHIEVDPFMKTRIQANIPAKRKPTKILITIVCVLVLVIGINVFPENSDYDGNLITFNSKFEVEKLYNRIEVYDYDNNTEDISFTGAPVSNRQSTHATTYKQEENVDEPDTIKTDGTYIYKLIYSTMCIYNTNKECIKILESINDCIDADMFIYDHYLVVNGNDYQEETTTTVTIFDINKDFKKVHSFTQSGDYVTSRIIGHNLYLVSSDYNSYPLVCNSKMNCKDVVSVKDPKEKNFLVISSIDLDNFKAKTSSKAILGVTGEVYCNEDHMYISTNNYNYYISYAMDDESTAGDASYDNTLIKVDLGEKVTIAASTTIHGNVNNQYSFDEYNGYLRVATTSSDNNKDICNLYVYDEDLNLTGKLESIEEDESIKAVRFIDNIAYIITYKEVDPLFTIDLSNPKKPKILGSVKIKGFSSTLVPVDKDKMLGIGYYTKYEDYAGMEVEEGVKLVLFDTSDLQHPKVLDTKVYKNCYSGAQKDTKAVVTYNSDFLIPMNFNNEQGGFIQLSIKDNKLNIKQEYRDEDLNYGVRVTYIGSQVYCLDDEGTIESEKLMD